MRTRTFLRGALLAAAFFAVAGSTLAQQGPPPGAGAGPPGAPGAGAPRRSPLVPMYIESKAFPDGGIVPLKYAGAAGGGNTQPDFKIIGAPPETQSFAIITHDIDVSLNGAGDVLHWVAWNIPGKTTQIEEGKLPEGSVNGRGLRGNAYMGMGAPAGPRYHHYVFEFYALSKTLDLPTTASRDELIAALNVPGTVIAKAAYIGRFRTEPGMAPAGGAPGAGGPPAPRPAQ